MRNDIAVFQIPPTFKSYNFWYDRKELKCFKGVVSVAWWLVHRLSSSNDCGLNPNSDKKEDLNLFFCLFQDINTQSCMVLLTWNFLRLMPGMFLLIMIRYKRLWEHEKCIENEKIITQFVGTCEICVRYGDRVSNSDWSCHICSMRLKSVLVKYEKYGTLSMYLVWNKQQKRLLIYFTGENQDNLLWIDK